MSEDESPTWKEYTLYPFALQVSSNDTIGFGLFFTWRFPFDNTLCLIGFDFWKMSYRLEIKSGSDEASMKAFEAEMASFEDGGE